MAFAPAPRNLLTVQVMRPNFEGLSKQEKEAIADELAKDIARQILTQEELRARSEEIAKWQQIFLKWQVEDYHLELLYEEYYRTNPQPE